MGPIALDIIQSIRQSRRVLDAFTGRKEKKGNTVCLPSVPAFTIPHTTDAHWGVRASFPPHPTHPIFPSLLLFFPFLSLFSLSLTCEWQPIRGRVASASASVTSTARSDALLEKEGGGGGGQGERSGGGRERRQERQRRDDRKKV